MIKDPRDLTFFQNLSNTETGRHLADYAKRVIDYTHDSRSWKDGDSKESAAQAARLIKEMFIEKIHPNADSAKVDNQFE